MLIENAAFAVKSDLDSGSAEPVEIGGRAVTVTGPFLHASAHRKNLFFKGTGDVTRSFTVLIALAKRNDETGAPNFNKNGIAIIDNDNVSILVDGIASQASGISGPSQKQLKAFEAISNKNWKDFVALIHAHDYYRGVAGDIDTLRAAPESGNFERQVMLGLKKPEDRDFRDAAMKSINDEGLYSLPATSRAGMVNQLLMHPTMKVADGLAFCWDVRMNFEWDSLGHVQDGEELDPQFDKRWKREFANNKEVFDRVCDIAIRDYLDAEFSVMGLDEAACELDTMGRNNGFVVMRKWRGAPAVAANLTELRENLVTMPDEELRTLWMSVKVLDQDFCRRQRTVEMQLACNEVRAELEAEWTQEIENELDFAQ